MAELGCGVKNCVYNKDEYCCKGDILVGGRTAHREEENGTLLIVMFSAYSKSLRANMRSHQSTEDACSSYSLPTSSSDTGSEY